MYFYMKVCETCVQKEVILIRRLNKRRFGTIIVFNSFLVNVFIVVLAEDRFG